MEKACLVEFVNLVSDLTSNRKSPLERSFINMRTLLGELKEIHDQSKIGKMRRNSGDVINEELNFVMPSDSVFIKICEDHKIVKKSHQSWKKWNEENYDTLCGKYLEVVLEDIRLCLSNNDIGEKLSELVQLLVAELIDRGFSCEYLYEFARVYLLNDSIGTSTERFNSFMQRVCNPPSVFNVVFKVNIEIQSERKYISKELPDFAGNTKKEKQFYENGCTFITVDGIEAYDWYSAQKHAKEYTRFIFGTLSSCDKDIGIQVDHECLIYDTMRNNRPKGGKKINDMEIYSAPNIEKVTDEQMSKAYEMLDETSQSMFKSAISAYYLAKMSDSTETKFLYLWTLLESLIKTPEGTIIINVVEETLAPILFLSISELYENNGQYKIVNVVKEIHFSLRRFYRIRNLFIHNCDVSAKMRHSIVLLQSYCLIILHRICKEILNSVKPEGKESLESIYSIVKKSYEMEKSSVASTTLS